MFYVLHSRFGRFGEVGLSRPHLRECRGALKAYRIVPEHEDPQLVVAPQALRQHDACLRVTALGTMRRVRLRV